MSIWVFPPDTTDYNSDSYWYEYYHYYPKYYQYTDYEAYEYKCPHCKTVNIRYCRTIRIVCSSCGEVFYA